MKVIDNLIFYRTNNIIFGKEAIIRKKEITGNRWVLTNIKMQLEKNNKFVVCKRNSGQKKFTNLFNGAVYVKYGADEMFHLDCDDVVITDIVLATKLIPDKKYIQKKSLIKLLNQYNEMEEDKN